MTGKGRVGNTKSTL